MAVDVVAVCDTSAGSDNSQGLALVLSFLFAGYLLLDSVLASYVILRKSTEAELGTASA
jgi:hypothetical protein